MKLLPHDPLEVVATLAVDGLRVHAYDGDKWCDMEITLNGLIEHLRGYLDELEAFKKEESHDGSCRGSGVRPHSKP